MKGRNRFTAAEAEQIREILRRKAGADRDSQKKYRGQLRSKWSFYISDFSQDQDGLLVQDFDQLVATGRITIESAASIPVVQPPRSSVPPAVVVDRASEQIAIEDAVDGNRQLLWPIEDLGFTHVGTVDALITKGLPTFQWLQRCGVYAIVTRPSYAPSFIEPEASSKVGNVVRPWSQSRLAAKWVPETQVLYIGLAGRYTPRSLHARLRDLIRHAIGKTSDNGPHCGGEILWQLQGHGAFSVLAMATSPPPAPRDMEETLLRSFHQRYGVLPFANRQA